MAAAIVRDAAAAPQACVFLTLDVTPTTELVGRLRANRHFEGTRVTPLSVVATAMVLAFPRCSGAELLVGRGDGRGRGTKHYVHLGVAVAGPLGLVVPSVKDVQDMTFRGAGAGSCDLSSPTTNTRCTPAELREGTITLTNIGIVHKPGRADPQIRGGRPSSPWAQCDGDLEDQQAAVALRDVVTLSLAFDHRLVDGQAASRYLTAVGEMLADPTNLIALGLRTRPSPGLGEQPLQSFPQRAELVLEVLQLRGPGTWPPSRSRAGAPGRSMASERRSDSSSCWRSISTNICSLLRRGKRRCGDVTRPAHQVERPLSGIRRLRTARVPGVGRPWRAPAGARRLEGRHEDRPGRHAERRRGAEDDRVGGRCGVLSWPRTARSRSPCVSPTGS